MLQYYIDYRNTKKVTNKNFSLLTCLHCKAKSEVTEVEEKLFVP